VRDIEVQPGGRFDGEGLVNGEQSIIALLPEFANMGLLEPRFINGGVAAVASEGDPSLDAGRLVVQGEFVQTSTGILQLDLFTNGSVGGLNFDQLAVTGKVSLAGVLAITVNDPSSYSLGNSFEIITSGGGLAGTFSSIVATPLQQGLAWSVHYETNSATLNVVEEVGGGEQTGYLARWRRSFGVDAAADLDGDGDTDAKDFLAWQRGEVPQFATIASYLSLWHQSVGKDSGADLDGDGDTDGHDYLVWQRGAAMNAWSSLSAVPEPTAWALIASALCTIRACRRCTRIPSGN
jgi:hypothetical protein